MADTSVSHKWLYRGLYIVIALVTYYIHLLPLQTIPRGWGLPDILLCLTFAWALRRPEYVPLTLVAALFFLGDMLFQRPPGLQSAAIILGLEFLRTRRGDVRAATFPTEWFMVVVTMVGILIFTRFVSAIALLDPPSLRLTLIQFVITAACYPFIAGLSSVLFKVRYPAANDISDRALT
ncbi:rod shape-determining protein MreD [Nereida sp. MMG025]|uniref:rod shape-determining protein MreD n=1 Tax=Nereida sp. MMG025 TaxID=2909981 RepID=UPI001F3DF73F|nr:rod shape-determining protein MreD [Nereida sp. MMG025]MCF6444173.1 rod shape-determining protein MreD [Nereida sp. MMG025]